MEVDKKIESKTNETELKKKRVHLIEKVQESLGVKEANKVRQALGYRTKKED